MKDGEQADVVGDGPNASAFQPRRRSFIGDTSAKIVDLSKIYRIPGRKPNPYLIEMSQQEAFRVWRSFHQWEPPEDDQG